MFRQSHYTAHLKDKFTSQTCSPFSKNRIWTLTDGGIRTLLLEKSCYKIQTILFIIVLYLLTLNTFVMQELKLQAHVKFGTTELLPSVGIHVIGSQL